MAKTSLAEQLPAPARAEHRMIPLSALGESPLNHRRTWGDMDELVESVRRQGVLQPVLVRPMGAQAYELVFGHRRYRAAKKADLVEIPAMVREMTDVEALEAQVVENVQRCDVHPLEEAEGYEQLLQQKEKAYTVDDIAAKVGKSKAYIYARMKLLALCPEARKAFYEGNHSASIMLLVARIPSPALQKDALQKLKPQPWQQDEVVSLREATSIIHDHFMLRLADAPFERGDAGLVKSAGACTACPKRSGAQPELFADVPKKAGDLCTDPACFTKKREAWQARQLAEAEAKGQVVLGGAEAKKAVGRYSGDSSATHVKLSSTCYDDPKNRTYAQLLGKKAPVSLARVENELVEVVEKKAVRDLLKEAGHKFATEATRTRASSDPAAQRERKKQELKRLTVRTAIATIVARAEARPFDDKAVDLLAGAILDLSWHDTSVEMANRRGLEREKGERPEEALEKRRKKMTPAELRGLMVEALVTRGAYFSLQSGVGDTLKAAAKFYGVDLEKCAAEAKATIQAKEDAKKKPKANSPPAKGKKTAGKEAARELPRGTAEELGAEECLDCGVAADQPSKGCDSCDHGRSKKTPAKKAGPAPLVWTEIEGTHRAELEGGEYSILPGSGAQLTWKPSWVPRSGPSHLLGNVFKLTDAKDTCQRHAAGKDGGR